MYNTPYYNNQINLDRLNNQIAELEKMKAQMQQPMQPAINQTFQLASQNNIKYANTFDEVSKEHVLSDTPFFTKDFSQMWLKNPNGNIKVYTLEEVVPQDEKDILISSLQMQVDKLRKEIEENAKSNNSDANEPSQIKKSTNVSNVRTSKKK